MTKKKMGLVRQLPPGSEKVVESKIFVVRGQKVMLATDLAKLYRVSAKVFNQAVRRNSRRFPEDFMFQLTKKRGDGSKVTNCDLRHWARSVFEVPSDGVH